MTAPESMGFPYMESIISSLSICDEVVLILGRDEEESDKKIDNLKSFLERDGHTDKLKIVRTHNWPEENWHYDVMKEHLQIGLDTCTGDLCMKIDADHVFRNQHADLIKQNLIKYAKMHHYVPINLVHFYSHNVASFRTQMRQDLANCYIINKKKLKEDGLTCKITNDKGSNRPTFFEKNGKEYEDVHLGLIGDFSTVNKENKADLSKIYVLCVDTFAPVNYSYTFCNKEQISKYWSRWFKARNMKFGGDKEFDYEDPDSSFEYFLKYYHEKKIPKRKLRKECPEIHDAFHENQQDFDSTKKKDYVFTHSAICWVSPTEETKAYFPLRNHPEIMKGKLTTMSKDMWGYNNFLEELEKM